MENETYKKAFLGLGSLAAGAGVGTAIASLVSVVVPPIAPIAGAVIGLLATAASGALTEPPSTKSDLHPTD